MFTYLLVNVGTKLGNSINLTSLLLRWNTAICVDHPNFLQAHQPTLVSYTVDAFLLDEEPCFVTWLIENPGSAANVDSLQNLESCELVICTLSY